MAHTRTHRAIVLIMILALAAAGCGGRKKNQDADKSAQQNASGGATIAGRVDLFSGFGLDMDRAGLADKIGQGATLKLYRFSGQGAELVPVDGFAPRPLGPDGAFTLDNTPAGQINLVLSVESQKGEQILSALIPFIPSGGVRNLMVTPETDLETAVFKQILLNRNRGGATLASLTHQNLDASLVKRIVTADAVFDPAVQQNQAAAAMSIGAAAASAMVTYVETLAGPNSPVSSPAVESVTTALRESASQVLMDQEWALINGVPGGADRAPAARMSQAISNAARQSALQTSGDLSAAATIAIARDRAVIQTARCLAGKGGQACPSPATGAVAIDNYARLLEAQVNQDAAARDAVMRLQSTEGATGTFDIAVLPALDNIQQLIALPDALTAPLRDFAIQSAAPLAQPGADMFPARDAALRNFAIIRDYTATGFLGMDHSSVKAMAADLDRRAAALAQTSSNPDSPLKDIAEQRKAFFNQSDEALAPLLTHINATFSKLPEADRLKLFHSMKSLFLCAGLEGVSAVLFQGVDTDGDGVDDDSEITLGTDVNKADSQPAVVAMASPETLLPDAPTDADRDGIPDIIELMNGTDPDDIASKPDLAALSFCSRSTQSFPCPAVASAQREDQMFTLSGQIMFTQAPVAGAVAGLYDTPVFMGRKPVYTADAPANASGSFVINAPAGRYFAAAFIDTNNNGAPDQGEAAGFLGAVYPEHIIVERNIVLASSVDMIGMIGGPPCQNGAWMSPDTGACEAQCPAGTSPHALTGECRCEQGGMFAVTTRQCVQSCPDMTVPGAGGTRCVCPPQSLLDQVQGVCHCGVGMTFDSKAAACVCSQGYFNPTTESCAESCPSGMPADEATRTCACPGGARFDQASGACTCENGRFLNSLTGSCVQQCPQGTTVDSAGRTCVCPRNQKPGPGGSCECEPGFVADEKSGECRAPTPDAAKQPRDTSAEPAKSARPDDDKKPRTPPSGKAPHERPDHRPDRTPPGAKPPSGESGAAPLPSRTTEEAGHTLTDPDADLPPGFVPDSGSSSDSN